MSVEGYLSGFAGLLRRVADRIDYGNAPRSIGWSFTFEPGRGLVFHEGRGRGCPLWYVGADDYALAYENAGDQPCRAVETLAVQWPDGAA